MPDNRKKGACWSQERCRTIVRHVFWDLFWDPKTTCHIISCTEVYRSDGRLSGIFFEILSRHGKYQFIYTSRFVSKQSFTRKRVNYAKMKIATKQRIMQIIPFLLASLTSFLFGIQKKTLFDLFYPLFHNKFFLNQHNFTKKCAKLWQTAHFRQNSVCSKPWFYPSSKILHEQGLRRSWHFPCLIDRYILSDCWASFFGIVRQIFLGSHAYF